MNSILIILLVLISILTLFYIYLLVLSNKILELEILIKKLLHQRTDLIPALYEVTKPYLLKHDEIFKEILTLRKLELSLNDSDDVSFIEVLKNERLIHHEMNFIYSICMKNGKLLKIGYFLYVKELTINKSYTIGEKVEKYRNIVKIFNNLISLKNYSLLGFMYPLEKKVEI